MIDTKQLRALAEAAKPTCGPHSAIAHAAHRDARRELRRHTHAASIIELCDALERKDAEIEALQARVAELQRGKDLEVKALAIDGAIVVSLFGMLVVLLHVAGVI